MKASSEAIALAVLLWTAAPCIADEEEGRPAFGLGIGWAHIDVGGSSSALHSLDALRFDPTVSFSPIPDVPQLRLGGAFGVSMVLDNSNRTIISSGGTLIVTGSSEVPFLTLEPEVRLSWRQPVGDTFFIEPGFGLGATFAHLDLSSDTASINKWESCFDARGFLNIGLEIPPAGELGLQLSYMHGGTLDFGQNAKGEL